MSTTAAPPITVGVRFYLADGTLGPEAFADWARVEGNQLILGKGNDRAVLAFNTGINGWQIAPGDSTWSGHRFPYFTIVGERA